MRLISCTGQYEIAGGRGSQLRTEAPRPGVRRRAPFKVQLRLWTSKDCGTNHVACFERIRVRVEWIYIATISQRNSAETGCIITIVDENVIGLNIYLEIVTLEQQLTK